MAGYIGRPCLKTKPRKANSKEGREGKEMKKKYGTS
jgi:hypothetical protein